MEISPHLAAARSLRQHHFSHCLRDAINVNTVMTYCTHIKRSISFSRSVFAELICQSDEQVDLEWRPDWIRAASTEESAEETQVRAENFNVFFRRNGNNRGDFPSPSIENADCVDGSNGVTRDLS